MNLEKIRSNSLLVAEKLGYLTNDSLPLLDEVSLCRSQVEIENRCLTLFAVVACSYGFDRESTLKWIDQENLRPNLTKTENEFLSLKIGDVSYYQAQVECLNAFAWALSIVKSISFDSVCDNSLIKRFPDIKNGGSSDQFRKISRIRPTRQIIAACDLSYCLHWAIREAETQNLNLPNSVEPYVIVERRRCFEWIISECTWDEVTLDT